MEARRAGYKGQCRERAQGEAEDKAEAGLETGRRDRGEMVASREFGRSECVGWYEVGNKSKYKIIMPNGEGL